MCFSLLRGLIAIVLSVLLAFASPANAIAANKYKGMVGGEKFLALKNDVSHAALNASKYRASDADRLIEQSLAETQRLSKKVNRSRDVRKFERQLEENLDEIATAYESASSFGKQMLSQRSVELSNLEVAKTEIQAELSALKTRIKLLHDDNERSRLLIEESEPDSIAATKASVTMKGNEAVIRSLNSQARVWERFADDHRKLVSSLKKNGDQLGLLVYAIDVNAHVYREASNTSTLMAKQGGKLDNLEGLASVKGVVDEMQDSWSQVDSIVSGLQNAEFSID